MTETEILNAIDDAYKKEKVVEKINGELLSTGMLYGTIRSPSWTDTPARSGPGNPVAKSVEVVEARRAELKKALRAAVQAHQEAWLIIAAGLGFVTDAEAEAIRLRALDGCSYAEAADRLGCSKAQAWKMVREAAHKMAGGI